MAAFGRAQPARSSRREPRLRRRAPPGRLGRSDSPRGFSPAERQAAWSAYGAFFARLETEPPPSDRASDALDPGEPWNPFLEAISGYLNGAPLAEISVADAVAYDQASTDSNWRLTRGYGALIAASFPEGIALRLEAPVSRIALAPGAVELTTPQGALRARAAIVTVSTAVLAGGGLALPSGLDAWREAAKRLPLGRNEKLFFEIVTEGAFAPETHVSGNPRNARAGSYYIRPFGRQVIEAFFGAASADIVAEEGIAAGFAHAMDELVALFGADVRRSLRPLAGSAWTRDDWIGGGYSHALPGCRAARAALAQPFENRIFFAGEATHPDDFSTVHGAHASGLRAAGEAVAALAGRPGKAAAGAG